MSTRHRVSAGLFASSEKADEAGHGAPFEYAARPRHPSQLEERNEILAKTITVTIEVLLEMHPVAPQSTADARHDFSIHRLGCE